MHRPDAPALLPVLTCAALLGAAPEASVAQEREVVASTVVVSRNEAALDVEFADGDPLALSFSDGVARLGDEVLGRYQAEGEADRAWRRLLAEVLPLTNGPLARHLRAWEPGEAISGADGQLLAEVDEALEHALLQTHGASARAPGGAPQEAGWVAEFMQGAQVEGFWDAVRDIDATSFEIVAGDDYGVDAGAVVDHGILVVDGRMDVRGTVQGDVVLVDATLAVHEGGSVLGDVRHVDSRVERMGGVVAGDVVDLVRERRRNAERERDRIRAELRRELRRFDDRPVDRRQPSAFARVRGALGDLVATAALFVVLALLAAGATTVAGERGEVVTRALGRDPAKSLVVGLAGTFLALPAYVVGIVALAVTIIGVLGLFVWIPLFPLAALAAAFVGLVATSRHVGAWVLARDYGFLRWANSDDRIHVAVVGLAALMAPMAAGKMLDAVPLIGWTGSLLEGLSTMALAVGAVAGLGAVITTRGGRQLGDDHAIHDDLEAAAWRPDVRYGTADAAEAGSSRDGATGEANADGRAVDAETEASSRNEAPAGEPGSSEGGTETGKPDAAMQEPLEEAEEESGEGPAAAK